MISCYYLICLYMVLLKLFYMFSEQLSGCFQCYFIISNSLNISKSIHSSQKKIFSSKYYVFYNPFCKSVLLIVKSYHRIFYSRIKFISPNIHGSNAWKFQTSLIPLCLFHIALFSISYQINYSENVSGVFFVLNILVHTHIWIDIQDNWRWLLWN